MKKSSYKFYYFFPVVVLFCFCNKVKNDTVSTIQSNNPYQVFFDNLKISNGNDTILMQHKTKVFGCGTAATEYFDNLEKKGLNKFFDKNGHIFDNNQILRNFESKNNLKILWINVGNEGELFELEDSKLHSNKKLETRLLNKKPFIVLTENPESTSKLTIEYVYNNPLQKNSSSNSYFLSEKSSIWKLDSIHNKNFTNK